MVSKKQIKGLILEKKYFFANDKFSCFLKTKKYMLFNQFMLLQYFGAGAS